MSIEISKVERAHMGDVVGMLYRNMSNFMPKEDELDDIWMSFSTQNNVHSIIALIDGTIVGYGSIVIETKIRGGRMGHIEDIVSHEKYRNKGIGRAIMDALSQIGKDKGCYKVALQCREHNVSFYEKCGYSVSGISMQKF
jgi:glucosamine-phosphate N-acetyltransferase